MPTVEVTLATSAPWPVARSAGKETSDPPPATPFTNPAAKPAAARRTAVSQVIRRAGPDSRAVGPRAMLAHRDASRTRQGDAPVGRARRRDRSATGAGRRCCARTDGSAWEPHREPAALTRCAHHVGTARVAVCDGRDGRETESGPSTQGFGGEERLEATRARRLVHPEPRVDDAQSHVLAGRQHASVGADVRRDRGLDGLEGDRPTCGGRVTRVQYEVQ